MRPIIRYTSLAAIAVALVAMPGTAQKPTGPKAKYDMDVETVSGLAGGMNIGSMLFGGGKGGNVSYRLDLRLGSQIAPTKGAEKADHFVLPAAKLGKSLTLLGDQSGTNTTTPNENSMPQNMQQPKGRLLLFWGCGARAPKGQPVILDFAKLAKGQVPPGLWTTKVPVERRVSARDFTHYASWPNGKSDKQPKSGSSLIGAHRVAGNFAPDINFALTQDYMPALNAKSTSQGDGSIQLRWDSLAPATGYVAWAMGSKGAPGQNDTGDMVWWTSSASRDFGGGLWDWLPPATVAKLVASKTILPPSQNSCNIPAEVKAASGGFLMGNLNAFGPEANFSYPPKPDNPKAVWNIDWTARVRYRASDMLMLTGGMGAMGGMDDGAAQPAEKRTCKGPFGVKIPC